MTLKSGHAAPSVQQ